MYIELGVSIAKIRCQPECRFMNLHPHGGSVVKNPPASAGDMDSIPGSERSPAEGNGNPSQYSCLGNPMDKEPGRL